MLMSAVPDRDLGSIHCLEPAKSVRLVAGALRDLHQIDPSECPFDHSAEVRISRACARLDAGLVDQTELDDQCRILTGSELYKLLNRMRPHTEDLVGTHGDACLPNLLAQDGKFSGFIDCGHLGIADRHQDLALAMREIERQLGVEWIPPFLEVYGLELDPVRIAFYCHLDEFF